MVITAVVKRADPKTTNGVVYPPTCIENSDKKIRFIHISIFNYPI